MGLILHASLFQGNYPDSVIIEATFIQERYPDDKTVLLNDNFEGWRPLLPASKLRPHDKHCYPADKLQGGGKSDNLQDCSKISHVRVKMFPDGGISRVRIMGTPIQ